MILGACSLSLTALADFITAEMIAAIKAISTTAAMITRTGMMLVPPAVVTSDVFVSISGCSNGMSSSNGVVVSTTASVVVLVVVSVVVVSVAISVVVLVVVGEGMGGSVSTAMVRVSGMNMAVLVVV